MWSFLGLVAITTLVLLVIFAGLVYLKAPVYRLEKNNLIRLFKLVLEGEATESDWDVFIDIPIRYDDDLEKIRLQCAELTEQDAIYANSQRRLCCTADGKRALTDFINQLS